MAEIQRAGEDSSLPDDFELVGRSVGETQATCKVAEPPIDPVRARNTPPQIFGLLERLGIDRFRDPWVWMTTKDRLSPELPRFRVHDGGPRRYVLLEDEDVAAFDGYSLEMLGIRLADESDPYYGLHQFWEGHPTDVRFIRARWQRSVLYAEFTATKSEKDAAIRGCHLHHEDKDRKRAWAAMGLIFRGLQRGAPTGKRGPRSGGEVERWVQRVRQIGETLARAEFKAETEVGRGAWSARYQWWHRNVRPHLQRIP
jgi:hypothetical protein